MTSRKNPIYKRMFIIYSLVSILIITSLYVFFVNYIKLNVSSQKMETNKRLVEDVRNTIDSNYDFSDKTMINIYNNKFIIDDLITFLKVDINSYIKQKLDILSESDKADYNGIQKFVMNTFNANEELIEISFVSYYRSEISNFNRKNQIKVEKIYDIENYKKYALDEIRTDKDEILYIREVKNPLNLVAEGLIIFKYNINQIRKIVESYNSNNEIFILNNDGYVVYDSSEEYAYEVFSNYSDILERKEKIKINDDYYINTSKDKLGMIIVGAVPVSYANSINIMFYLASFIIGIGAFIIAQAIIYFRFRKVKRRIDSVINAMDSVRSGNLDIKLDISGEDDEIRYISESFNRMCSDLDNYIKISYLAEVKRKNAEMSALQSKINPHFLYNTLETIRMKAICNGDKDVGRMLYLLANLFRNQLKDKDIITIKSEVEYCRKYLELFKFRYEDKFTYKITYNEELEEVPIIKFILQPIIENYLIHGIRVENDDNRLEVDISRNDNEIVIIIKDNGRGIREEELREINRRLEERDFSGNSIGIINAHERIIIAYGEKYGIKLEENFEVGTKVKMIIPYGKR